MKKLLPVSPPLAAGEPLFPGTNRLGVDDAVDEERDTAE